MFLKDDLDLWLTEWDEPEEGIVAEDGGQVAAETPVIRLSCVESLVFLATLLAELNGCELAGDQVEVESHEGCDDKCQDAGQDVGSHDEVADFVVKSVGVAQSTRNDRVARSYDQ